jgi:hypothetical protein
MAESRVEFFSRAAGQQADPEPGTVWPGMHRQGQHAGYQAGYKQLFDTELHDLIRFPGRNAVRNYLL